MFSPGVSNVIEIAKVDCSGRPVVESDGTFAGGTGMYVVMRDARVCFWMENSEIGPSGVWILTARPLKQGILRSTLEGCYNFGK
jgi:hypothetical protein